MVLSSKNGIPEKNKFQDLSPLFQGAASRVWHTAVHICPFLLHRISRRHFLKGWNLIKQFIFLPYQGHFEVKLTFQHFTRFFKISIFFVDVLWPVCVVLERHHY